MIQLIASRGTKIKVCLKKVEESPQSFCSSFYNFESKEKNQKGTTSAFQLLPCPCLQEKLPEEFKYRDKRSSDITDSVEINPTSRHLDDKWKNVNLKVQEFFFPF